MVAVITVVEKATGKILLKPTPITADTNALTHDDLPTAKRDALHRATHELGRQIVLAVVSIW
jgi:hypothetical protein